MLKFNTELGQLGNRLIKEQSPKFNSLAVLMEEDELKIAFLESTKAKRHNDTIVYGDCQKLSEKQRLMSGYDFAITFYADGMSLPDEKKAILMEHELMHIGVDIDEPKKKFIAPHDLSDFKDIVHKYGVDWPSNDSVSRE